MSHGRSTCQRCDGLLVRDMYGVWYHDHSQNGIANDDDHAPEPRQEDLVAILKAEQTLHRTYTVTVMPDCSEVIDKIEEWIEEP